MKKNEFSKMHVLGNDFVLVNLDCNDFLFSIDLIRTLSNRKIGIGFDQLLLLKRSADSGIDYICRIFNSDGTEAYQCGNGSCCSGYFLYKKKLIRKKEIKIQMNNGRLVSILILDKNNVQLNIGVPSFNFGSLDFKLSRFNKVLNEKFSGGIIYCGIIFFGNFHCVFVVSELDYINISKFVSFLKEKFKDSYIDLMNFCFMKIINKKLVKLRVFERGVGETQSCGSGACASVVVGIRKRLLSKRVSVLFSNGSLSVFCNNLKDSVIMTTSVNHVFDGVFRLFKNNM